MFLVAKVRKIHGFRKRIKDNCHIITIPHNVVGKPCRKFLSLSVGVGSGCCLGGYVPVVVNVNKAVTVPFDKVCIRLLQIRKNMFHDLSHVESIFGVYLQNLIGMDTRMKDSIDLGRMMRDDQKKKSLKGTPKVIYL